MIMKYSKIKFLAFFAIICSIGLAPINDASAATTFVDAFDVSDQDTNPKNAVFNSDGTKMFVAGAIGDDINEYACTTGFDVSTCSFTDSFSVSGQESNPWGIAFNSDGTKMFVTGNISDKANEYACTTGFDVSTCSFTDAFSVSAQETQTTGLAFNTDGTKMFVTGFSSDNVNEYACTTGFDVSTCSFTDAFDVSAQETQPNGIAFNSDGTKMFVAGSSGDAVNEYACTAFDVSTCSFTDAFDVSAQETGPSGVSFNTDGTKMFVVGPVGDDVNEYTLSVGFDLNTAPSGSDCYDCTPPTLQSAHVTISSNDYVVATGDDTVHITVNVGDTVTVTLKVTDDKPVDTIPFAGLYTNYQERPSDMSLYYANNYNNLKQVSTSFYEWNIRADDVKFDHEGAISWNDSIPKITATQTDKPQVTSDTFTIPFTFTIEQHMDLTQITAKVFDQYYNRLQVTLPVVLHVAGNDLLDFENMGKQKLLSFFNDAVLTQTISDWNDSEPDVNELSAILGLPDESLPAWSTNLATWVAEDKIESANMIVAVEYLINQ
jgi:DNA-binding beta-propeller fold protein YncE